MTLKSMILAIAIGFSTINCNAANKKRNFRENNQNNQKYQNHRRNNNNFNSQNRDNSRYIQDQKAKAEILKLGLAYELDELASYLLENNQKAIDQFLSRKVNINRFIPDPTTLMYLMMYVSNHPAADKIGQVLIKSNKSEIITGITPLGLAAEHGTLESVQKLVKAGANPNLEFDKGILKELKLAIDKLLIELKSPKFQGILKELIIALRNKKIDNISIKLENSYINSGLKNLLEELDGYWMCVNILSTTYNTPLMRAIRRSDTEGPKIVEALLKANADVNATNSAGVSPLMHTLLSFEGCSHKEKPRVLALTKKLIDLGAKINHKSLIGSTALSFAQSRNLLELLNSDITWQPVIDLLIKNGADNKVQKDNYSENIDEILYLFRKLEN